MDLKSSCVPILVLLLHERLPRLVIIQQFLSYLLRRLSLVILRPGQSWEFIQNQTQAIHQPKRAAVCATVFFAVSHSLSGLSANTVPRHTKERPATAIRGGRRDSLVHRLR